MFVLQVYQAQQELMEKYYGDPRGAFSCWKNIKQFEPHRLVDDQLDMRPFLKVFEANIEDHSIIGDMAHDFRCARIEKEGAVLEHIYDLFNRTDMKDMLSDCFVHPELRPMSAGDVIRIKTEQDERFYFVDRFGFKKIRVWFPDGRIRLLYVEVLHDQDTPEPWYVSYLDTVPAGELIPEKVYVHRVNVFEKLKEEGKATLLRKNEIPAFFLSHVERLLRLGDKKMDDFDGCAWVYKAELDYQELYYLEKTLPSLPWDSGTEKGEVTSA